ncbi:MAG: hypothetical protein PHS57_05105 [Alphaproteobacteria bacterium]|nr:hypothetical protein [Alphaproteobacteria bacterium]
MLPIDKNLVRVLDGAPHIVVSTMALMEELVQVLGREETVVTKRLMEEHAALLKRKQWLAANYRANMTSILKNPSLAKGLSDEAKAAVREMSDRLTKAAASNARMLKAASEATCRLVQNVMAMVKRETLPQQVYKNHAKAHLHLGRHSPSCRAVAFSRIV